MKKISFLLVLSLVCPSPNLWAADQLPTEHTNFVQPVISSVRITSGEVEQRNLVASTIQHNFSLAATTGQAQTPSGLFSFEQSEKALLLRRHYSDSLPDQLWQVDLEASAVYTGNEEEGEWKYLALDPETYIAGVESLLNALTKLLPQINDTNTKSQFQSFRSAVEDVQFTHGRAVYGSYGLKSIRYYENGKLLGYSNFNSQGRMTQINWFADNHLDNIIYFNSQGRAASQWHFNSKNALVSLEDFLYTPTGEINGSDTWLDENRSKQVERRRSSPDNTRDVRVVRMPNGNGLLVQLVDISGVNPVSLIQEYNFDSIIENPDLFSLGLDVDLIFDNNAVTVRVHNGENKTEKKINLTTGALITDDPDPILPDFTLNTSNASRQIRGFSTIENNVLKALKLELTDTQNVIGAYEFNHLNLSLNNGNAADLVKLTSNTDNSLLAINVGASLIVLDPATGQRIQLNSFDSNFPDGFNLNSTQNHLFIFGRDRLALFDFNPQSSQTAWTIYSLPDGGQLKSSFSLPTGIPVDLAYNSLQQLQNGDFVFDAYATSQGTAFTLKITVDRNGKPKKLELASLSALDPGVLEFFWDENEKPLQINYWYDNQKTDLVGFALISPDQTRILSIGQNDTEGNDVFIDIGEFSDGTDGNLLKSHELSGVVDLGTSADILSAATVEFSADSQRATITFHKNGAETQKTYNLVTGDEILPSQPHTDTETFNDLNGQRYKEVISSFNGANQLTSKIEKLYLPGTDSVYQKTTFNVQTGKAQSIEWYTNYPVPARKQDLDANGNAILITAYDASGNVTQTYGSSQIESNDSLNNWYMSHQGSSGLIPSYPDNQSFIYHEGNIADWAKIYAYTQAYTYDQAVTGIALLDTGNTSQAKKIFDFYYNEYKSAANFDGFWTVYNTDINFQWKKYEWYKNMGENAWLAFFVLHYRDATSDPVEKQKALEVATAIGKWISTLPHYHGGVAKSAQGDWASVYAVENNLDYYTLSQVLSNEAASASDRQLFATEHENLKNWLKNEVYNPVTGLFQRGGRLTDNSFEWDGLASLDVNSWAIEAIRPEVLKNEFGINLDAFLQKINTSFSVQNNNSFGGNIFSAKGFDFSDQLNANLTGRPGTKWVEGTNQMVVAYQQMAAYYESNGDTARAAYYASLAAYFRSQNPSSLAAATTAGGYEYADIEGYFVYFGNFSWVTTTNQAAPSAAWISFGLNGKDPFKFD